MSSIKCNSSGKSILKTCSSSGTCQIAKLFLKSLKTDRRGVEETCSYIFLDELEVMKIFFKTCPIDKPWFIKSSNIWRGRQAHRDYKRQKRTNVKSIVFFIEWNFIYYGAKAIYITLVLHVLRLFKIIQN